MPKNEPRFFSTPRRDSSLEVKLLHPYLRVKKLQVCTFLLRISNEWNANCQIEFRVLSIHVTGVLNSLYIKNNLLTMTQKTNDIKYTNKNELFS